MPSRPKTLLSPIPVPAIRGSAAAQSRRSGLAASPLPLLVFDDDVPRLGAPTNCTLRFPAVRAPLLASLNGISAAVLIVEDADTVAAAAQLAIAGTSSIAEAADTLASTAVLAIAAQVVVAEAGDTASSISPLAIAGQVALAEAADQVVAAGALESRAQVLVVDADSVVAAAAAAIVAQLTVAEADDQVAASAIQGVEQAPVVDPAPALASGLGSSLSRRSRARGFFGSREFPQRTPARVDPAPLVVLAPLAASVEIEEDDDLVVAAAELLPGLRQLQRRRTLQLLAMH